MIPDKEMAIASTADCNDYQPILNLYWKHLYPPCFGRADQENPEAQENLKGSRRPWSRNRPRRSSSRRPKIQEVLGRVSYTVYLPKNYLTRRPLEDVHLLHGASDDHTTWINPQQGQPGNMPTDPFRNAPKRNESCLSRCRTDLHRNNPTGMHKTLPTDSKRWFHAPGRETGQSPACRWGYGSLLWTLRHPELFSSCYAISAAVGKEVRTSGKKGDQGITSAEYAEETNIFRLARWFPDEYKRNTRFYLDCGDRDILLRGNRLLYNLMKERGFSVDLRVREGEHNWVFFRSALPKMFEFLNNTPKESQ